MKISLNWIKDYVKVDASVKELVERLTMSGIEAEKIEKVDGDPVIEFEVTPNRPDCLNMIGMAREISAVLNKPLTPPKISTRKYPSKKCEVTIEAPEACARYIGTVIEGVKVFPSPVEFRKRLAALGNRAISNVVDITNYCLFEIGQPLHAFDLDKLEGEKIVVRFARKGEKLTTLDGVERELDPLVLVIADAKKPVALAGVMGGANSEVTEATKNILLESAYFDPVLIRRTVRKLGLASDSSYRFERGVVFDHVKTGADRAVDLILKQAGGAVTARADVVGSTPIRHISKAGRDVPSGRLYKINLDLKKMNSFLGASIPATEAKRILKALGFSLTASKTGTLKVTPPVFRQDVERPEDLYEEVARVVGYNNLPGSFPCVKLTGMRSNPYRGKRQFLADQLLSQGFNEVLTYSLISNDQVERVGVSGFSTVKVLNPLSKEQEILRPHLLPSLLQVAHINVNHGQKDLAVFEAGKIYPHGGEKEALGMLMTGCLRADWRTNSQKPFDFYDLKGAVEKTFRSTVNISLAFRVSEESWLEEGQRADVFAVQEKGPNSKNSFSKKIGSFGKIADAVLQQNGIKQQDVFFAQLDLEAVYDLSDKRKRKKFIPLSEYPAITRDVSVAVDKKILFEDVCRIVHEFGSEDLRSIQFKEEYLGEKIPAGQRGLVFSVIYQSSKRTLTEEEIQAIHENVLSELGEQLGAVIR